MDNEEFGEENIGGEDEIEDDDYEYNYELLNLTPKILESKLKSFSIAESTVNQLCASLNAGKNIILDGTPGTGKTELAIKFSTAASENNFMDGYILTTATSDWSTFDTIGGLMPNEKGELFFYPGKFLDAIAENKWLIIDEINRADIDKAFGQLFTVLSKQDVELPYKENDKPIKIKLWDENYSKYDVEKSTYFIGNNWRIIGTMNVDDKDSLFDLSYAFMRRFMFIEVDLPEENAYKRLIRMWSNDLSEEYLNKLLRVYDVIKFRKLGPAIFKDMIDDNYLNNVRMQSKKDDLINSEPHRGTHKKSINSDISDGNTINDFQLVIDYNNTKNPDLYEEKLKNDGKKEQIIDKYSQLRRFVMTKKNLMNYDLNIECHNYKEIFYAIKNSNIYYNIKFILLKNKNPSAPFTNKPKILSLNVVLNKYFEFMIKNKSYNLINETLFFSFNNNKVDYEMLGIILSILFIYPDIKLKYKLSLILCKILVNQRLELNDIKYVNNELYNSLFSLSKDKNVSSKGLVYYYEGNELLIDGKNTKVTSKNVFDYIEKLINYELRKYKNEINIIKSNLFQFVPKKNVFYFNGEEIYRIINRTL